MDFHSGLMGLAVPLDFVGHCFLLGMSHNVIGLCEGPSVAKGLGEPFAGAQDRVREPPIWRYLLLRIPVLSEVNSWHHLSD